MDSQFQLSQPREAELRTGKRSRDWESHLPKIKRLRYEERKPVKEIIVILRDEDSFIASEREYKEKLAQDVRKNLKKDEKIQIALKQYERLLKYNKQSIFYLADQVVDMRKIERYMKSNDLSVESIYGNMQNLSVLLPPSISVCTPPSSPILEAANALPHLQLSVDSTTAVARQSVKDADNNVEDIMLSLSLEDSATSPNLPQTTLQYAPTVSRSSSAQFRSFWTQFRSDTKSGSLYAFEMSLKSQASLKPFSVTSKGRPSIPSVSTPPLSKVMDEWERYDLSRTRYLRTKAPSSANGTISPYVTTLSQERPRRKDYFDVEPVSFAVDTELQEDDQGNHFFFEQDTMPEEDEVIEQVPFSLAELASYRLSIDISINGVEDGDHAVPLPLYRYGGDSKDVWGGAPLSYITEGGRKAAVPLHEKAEMINLDNQDNWRLLWLAAASGHKAIVQQELEKSKPTNLDLEDRDGRTLLSCAATNGHEAVVKLLLEKGAELETKDAYDRTPLSWAVAKGHEAVVKLLVEKGAELETKDSLCRTPLSWAAKNGHEAVVKLLVEKGAELETKNSFGRMPLSWAAENGHEAVVKLLVEKGAELEIKDESYNQTPLSWAAEKGHEAVVKLLLEKGAELETRDAFGRTPLSWAAENGHKAVVRLLVEKGAKLETTD